MADRKGVLFAWGAAALTAVVQFALLVWAPGLPNIVAVPGVVPFLWLRWSHSNGLQPAKTFPPLAVAQCTVAATGAVVSSSGEKGVPLAALFAIATAIPAWFDARDFGRDAETLRRDVTES